MREILFRGKRIDNGKWIEGYYASFEQLQNSCIYYVYKGHTLVADVDPETVCQYTGLTDENGRKIFEGDILCNHYNELFPEDKTMSLIVWDGFGWGIKYRDVVDKLDDFDCRNGEVIGNIFDNSELIGGAEK